MDYFCGAFGPYCGLMSPVVIHFHLYFIVFLCGSVVEHCVSSAKVVGSIPREHIYWQKHV